MGPEKSDRSDESDLSERSDESDVSDRSDLRSFFATTAKGTEDLLADELRELRAGRVRQDRGGVRFIGDLETALRVCLWSRIAMRILMPIAAAEAVGADGLYDAAAQVPWEEYLSPRSTFAVEAVLKSSEHSHSGFVALKIKDAIVDRLRRKLGERPDVETRRPDVRVVARLAKQQLSLSLDLTGEPLFQRGYRAAGGIAPLKPTLAAAMLRAGDYRGDAPLLDPLCGSGTILIEAAMIACDRAPGLRRRFGVERWPNHSAEAEAILADLRADARRRVHPPAVDFIGIDKNLAAIAAARDNVDSARLSDAIDLRHGDATAPLHIDTRPAGYVVTNPPYGERSGGGGNKLLKSFYFRLGAQLSTLHGWRSIILAGNPDFESAFHRRPAWRRALWNGPIECELLGYEAV